jgi:hypothetical protein
LEFGDGWFVKGKEMMLHDHDDKTQMVAIWIICELPSINFFHGVPINENHLSIVSISEVIDGNVCLFVVK